MTGFAECITRIITADLGNLATGSQTVGSRYLGYEPKLYTTMMSHSPYRLPKDLEPVARLPKSAVYDWANS